MANFGNGIMGFFGSGGTGGGGGGVSAVGGVAPISSSGGSTPNISIPQANGSTNGYLSFGDWSTFNSKVGGSGTQNKLPKWASGGASLSDSQIFDNGTSVGIGTTSPTSGFLFDVNTTAIVRNYFQVGTFTKGANQTAKIITDGIISSEVGFNLATVSATDVNKTGIYNGGNILQFWAGNNQIANFGLASAGGTLCDFIAGWVFNTGDVGNSKAVRIQSSLSSNSTNSAGLTQLLIDPTYNQGTFGTGTIRGIYYSPITSVLNGSTHIAWENTSGDVIFGNLAGVSDRPIMINSLGKISYQVDDFNLYRLDGSQDGVSIFLDGQYRFGNIPQGKTMIIDTTSETTIISNTGVLLNSTYTIFNASNQIKFATENLIFNGTTLITTDKGNSSPDHLLVTINSLPYLIQLRTPTP